MRARLLAAIFFCGLGCAPAEKPLRGPSSEAVEDLPALASSLKKNEAAVLSTLGRGDPRIAVRVPISDVAPDGEPTREGGLYAAQVRAKSLEEAETLFAGWRDERALRSARAEGAKDLRLERELLRRLLGAERFRIEEEKDLPRAGSEIVRGIILVGADPAKAPWVARRLDEIRLRMRPESLTALESAELDDSLDPLERGAPNGAQAAIAGLRVALAEAKTAPSRAAEPERIGRALAMHLGVSGPLPARRDALEKTFVLLAADITARGKRLSSDDVRLAESHAEEILSGSPERCVEGETGSVLRDALPPPERWGACQALAALVLARTPLEILSTLMALHDGVAVALWALSARAEGMDPDRANERWRLLAAIPPERQSRILRGAVARPVPAIAAGLAIQMITRGGLGEAAHAARAWRRFGDAPFDVIEREVLSGRTTTGAAH